MLLSTILQLRGFIFLMLAVILCCFIAVMILMGLKKKGLKDFKLQALFLGRSVREILLICVTISRAVLVLSVPIFTHTADTAHYISVVFLCLLHIGLSFSVSSVISEVLCGALSVGALMTGSLLFDYMTDTGFDIYIFLIWLMLMVFVFAFNVYDSIRSIDRMLSSHVAKRIKKQERMEQKKNENVE